MRTSLLLLSALTASPGWVEGVLGFSFARKSAGLAPRTDTPSADEFLRYAFPGAIVVGDYVYIDGGEISHLFDGKNGSSLHPSYTVNSTLSISLKESWTNTTVQVKATKKAAPLLNAVSYWRDPSSKALYAWGGISAYFATPPANELWRFETDGEGGGTWKQVQPSSVVTFSQLTRTVGGACTQSKDVGYCLSGYANTYSDTSISGDTFLAVPGLVEYNMTSNEFKNASATGFNEFGTLVYGASHFVPFGPNGLLLFLGGGSAPVLTEYGAWTQLDFNTLTIYDPKAEKWYKQSTTGSRPAPRERFCTVGVQGPNNTYEIFIYGGISSQSSSAVDSVYVLSLPGFIFFKASGDSTVRADHTCVVVGKRQMLSIGGTNGFLGFPDSLLEPDPWKRGLGIFDMTEMRWTGGYDAGAADYTSPEIVRQWYSQGGLDSVSWSSNELKELFATSAPPGSGSDPSAPSGPQGSDDKDEDKASKGSSKAGPIAGGVIGGLALVAIIAGAVIFIRRRKKARYMQGDVGELEGQERKNPMFARSTGNTPMTPTPAYSGPTGAAPVELPADHGASELLSPHGRQEMPVSTRQGYEF